MELLVITETLYFKLKLNDNQTAFNYVKELITKIVLTKTCEVKE